MGADYVEESQKVIAEITKKLDGFATREGDAPPAMSAVHEKLQEAEKLLDSVIRDMKESK